MKSRQKPSENSVKLKAKLKFPLIPWRGYWLVVGEKIQSRGEVFGLIVYMWNSSVSNLSTKRAGMKDYERNRCGLGQRALPGLRADCQAKSGASD